MKDVVAIRIPTVPAHQLSQVHCEPSVARSTSVMADAWDLLARSFSAMIVGPSASPRGPNPTKLKQIPEAAFNRFQLQLVHDGIAELPYCPRQYYNNAGERYVVSRAYAFGAFGRVHIGVRSSDGLRIALKEVPVKGKWRPSAGPKTANPHCPCSLWGEAIVIPKTPTPQTEIDREIDIAAHAGMSPLDTFTHGGRHFIVTELMAGDLLETVNALHNRGTSCHKQDTALNLLYEVSHQMRDVHAHGVVHRDLKLENVLYGAAGGLRVTDFGWAEKLLPHASMVGAFAGTLGCIPLEAIMNEPTDHRFDVFSLGVMVVTAALGRRMFSIDDYRQSKHDIADYEEWLNTVRVPGTGKIDTRALRYATGCWAVIAHDLIRALGTDAGLFVLNRMLTANLEYRATMAEVAKFCDTCTRMDAKTRGRARAIYQVLATYDSKREALLEGIARFDKAFPPAASINRSQST